MGASEFIAAAIPIFLSIMVPGLAIAFPLLKRAKLSLFEIVCFGFAVGLIVPPSIAFVANVAGVEFSLEVVLGIMALITIAGVAWYAYGMKKDNESYSLKIPKVWFSPKRDAIPLVVGFIMVLSFFIRVQSFGPYFYEFDPYYYIYIARHLLVLGYVPHIDYTAWYPEATGHGNIVLTGYLEAAWYEIYTGGSGQYDNLLLSTIANIYPPVVAALICFFAYALVKQEYGDKAGILAAGLMAVTPRLIEKTAAGEAEIMPWGLFSSFFLFAAYAMAVGKRDRGLAALAGIALVSAYFGSAYVIVVTLVVVGYSLLETIRRYLRMESLRDLLEINLVVFAFALFAYLVKDIGYSGNIGLNASIMMMFAAVAGMASLYYVELNSKKKETRYNLLIGISIFGLVLLFITPLGNLFFSYLTGAVAFAKPSDALMQTVSEESSRTPGQFINDAKSSFGILGDIVSLGFPLSLGKNQVHIPFVLLGSLAALFYALYARQSRLSLLYLVVVFPVAYVGLQKSKYILQFGFMLIIGVAVLVGEVYRYLSENAKKNNRPNLDVAYTVFIGLFLLGAASGPLNDIMPTALTFEKGSCGEVIKDFENGNPRTLSYYMYCSKINGFWIDAMDWIKNNVGEDDRVLSWWDYGHWINFFGDRPTVTRNEHHNASLDLAVADVFVEGTPGELKDLMKTHDATHVLFDKDVIDKWGALKYLSCVHNNMTDMGKGLGGSECDREYAFEYVFVPIEPTLDERCVLKDGGGQFLRLASSTFGYNYCIKEESAMGRTIVLMYNTGPSNPKESFSLDPDVATVNKGVLLAGSQVPINNRQYAQFLVAYPEVWYDGTSGLPDRKGKAYDSNFYKGFFLGKIEGFKLVYPEDDPGGLMSSDVRIFKVSD